MRSGSRSCSRRRAPRCATATSRPRRTRSRSALALWRGPALQGLTGTAWFGAEARRLETLHVDALEEDFEVRLALGEHRELTPALRSALADNPFRERLWGQLMLALYRSGRQADALETFQEARRVLADELGLEPGPELRRLQEAILAHDPAIAAVPVDRRRRGNLPAPSTSFVGREDELARGRRAPARAPPRDAHRPARRGQEPARGRDGTLARGRVPGRHLARRLRARGRRGRRRPAARTRRRRSRLRPARARDAQGFGTRRLSSFSTRASTCSTRRRGSRRRSSRSAPGPDPGDEPRGAPRRERGETPRRAARGRGRRPLPRACAGGTTRIRAGRRGCRARRPRSPGASTDCRSRSSSPPRA